MAKCVEGEVWDDLSKACYFCKEGTYFQSESYTCEACKCQEEYEPCKKWCSGLDTSTLSNHVQTRTSSLEMVGSDEGRSTFYYATIVLSIILILVIVIGVIGAQIMFRRRKRKAKYLESGNSKDREGLIDNDNKNRQKNSRETNVDEETEEASGSSKSSSRDSGIGSQSSEPAAKELKKKPETEVTREKEGNHSGSSNNSNTPAPEEALLSIQDETRPKEMVPNGHAHSLGEEQEWNYKEMKTELKRDFPCVVDVGRGMDKKFHVYVNESPTYDKNTETRIKALDMFKRHGCKIILM